MSKVVFVDLDGTLVDNFELHLASLAHSADDFGIPKSVIYESVGVDFIKASYGGPDAPVISRIMNHGSMKYNPAMVEEFGRKYKAHFKDMLPKYSALNSGTLKFFKKNELACVGLVSANVGEIVYSTITSDKCCLADKFDFIITGDDVTNHKPHPEAYEKAVSRASAVLCKDLNPRHCIAIEDSISGVSAAKAAGLTVYAVRHTNRNISVAAPDAVYDNISDITII